MQNDEFSGWNIGGYSMLDTAVITAQGSGNFNPIMFVPIPNGTPGSFTTLAEIKSLFTATSGFTMYGNGSDNGMSRKGSGEIYGTWDFNEMIIANGGGNQLKFYLHKANYLNHTLRAVQMAGQSVNQANNIAPIIAPDNNISISITVTEYIRNLHDLRTDSTDINYTFEGSKQEVYRKIDSTYNNMDENRASHDSWEKHYQNLKK